MRADVDLYGVLGVSRDAPVEEIRLAYQRGMRCAHPDMGGSTEDARALNEAWAVLGDARARAEYDCARGFGVSEPVSSGVGGGVYVPADYSREDVWAAAWLGSTVEASGASSTSGAYGSPVGEAAPDVAGAAFGVAYETGRAVRRGVHVVWVLVSLCLVCFVAAPGVMFLGDAAKVAGAPVVGDVLRGAGLVLMYGAPVVALWSRFRRRNRVRSGSGGFARVEDDGSVRLFARRSA